MGKEILRLNELKKINTNIKDQEILLAQTRMNDRLDHLSKTRIRMDAIRLIRVQ